MTRRLKIYAAGAAAVLIATAIVWSVIVPNRRTASLERRVDEARERSRTSDLRAAASSAEAERYKEKIAYLERQLAEIRMIAKEQDEEIEKLDTHSRSARSDVERARGTRAIAATTEALCAKLAELGHGCDP